MPNPFAEAMERMRALMAGLRAEAPAAPTAPPVSAAPRAPELPDEPDAPSEWPATVIEPRPDAPAEQPPATTRRRAIWSPPEFIDADGRTRREFTPVEVLAVAEGWAMCLVEGDTRPCVQPVAHLTWRT